MSKMSLGDDNKFKDESNSPIETISFQVKASVMESVREEAENNNLDVFDLIRYFIIEGLQKQN